LLSTGAYRSSFSRLKLILLKTTQVPRSPRLSTIVIGGRLPFVIFKIENNRIENNSGATPASILIDCYQRALTVRHFQN
jgi:hypothetical protein